jgi:hypothetical protein
MNRRERIAEEVRIDRSNAEYFKAVKARKEAEAMLAYQNAQFVAACAAKINARCEECGQ